MPNWTLPNTDYLRLHNKSLLGLTLEFLADDTTGDIADTTVPFYGRCIQIEYVPGDTPSVAGVTPTFTTPDGTAIALGGSALTAKTILRDNDGYNFTALPEGCILSCTNATALANGKFIFTMVL